MNTYRIREARLARDEARDGDKQNSDSFLVLELHMSSNIGLLKRSDNTLDTWLVDAPRISTSTCTNKLVDSDFSLCK